jgi:uncharacterized Zn-finger protein
MFLRGLEVNWDVSIAVKLALSLVGSEAPMMSHSKHVAELGDDSFRICQYCS